MKEAGVTTPVTIDFMVTNGPGDAAVAEVVQSMVAEAGFDLKLRVTEVATALKQAEDGDFQLYLNNWSGRIDPDGNTMIYQTCGAPHEHGPLLRQGGRRPARAGARRQRPRPRARRPTRSSPAKFLAERLDLYLYHPQYLIASHRPARGLQADAGRAAAGGRA